PDSVWAPLPAGSWGTAEKPRRTRNVVQTNPEIAVRGMTCSWRLNARSSGLATARYHTVAPERRCASQQKLRADVADGSCVDGARGSRIFWLSAWGRVQGMGPCYCGGA